MNAKLKLRLKQGLVWGIASLVLTSCAGANQPSATATAIQPTASVAQAESAIASSPNSSLSSSPSPSPSAPALTVVKSGRFVAGEHSTEGTARIVAQGGRSFLELDQSFQTSDSGPDLVVILHRSANALSTTQPPAYPLTEGDYVVLAPLQKFSGAQRYAIPDTVNLAEYQSAGIWCRKFNATFGIAALQ